MDIIENIKSRRTIGLMKEDLVPDEIINKLLDVATWAPNHKKTEPWKFRVVTGDSRIKLGKEMISIIKNELSVDSDKKLKQIDKIKKVVTSAPVIIAIAVSPSGKVPKIEEVSAVSCAIQNMLLTANEMGLASIWRTGNVIYQKELNNFLSLSESDDIIGLIYLGYSKKEDIPISQRTNFKEKTKWYK